MATRETFLSFHALARPMIILFRPPISSSADRDIDTTFKYNDPTHYSFRVQRYAGGLANTLPSPRHKYLYSTSPSTPWVTGLADSRSPEIMLTSSTALPPRWSVLHLITSSVGDFQSLPFHSRFRGPSVNGFSTDPDSARITPSQVITQNSVCGGMHIKKHCCSTPDPLSGPTNMERICPSPPPFKATMPSTPLPAPV